MNETNSITRLIQRLETDESLAARELWDRFIHRLIQAARVRLKNLPRRAADEEDVAITAFDAFLRGVKDNRFARLEHREDLWQVLAMLTERKAIALMRSELAQKRGGGLNRGESVFDHWITDDGGELGIANVPDSDPETVDGFTRDVREMLESLKDAKTRDVANAKLAGYTNEEVAQRLRISLRAVERKLQLIRKKWERVTEQDE